MIICAPNAVEDAFLGSDNAANVGIETTCDGLGNEWSAPFRAENDV
jgi:hypothetical protein